MVSDHRFTKIRRSLALQAKRAQFRARQNQFLFSLFYAQGPYRFFNIFTSLLAIFISIGLVFYFSFFYSTRYYSEFNFSIQNSSFFHPASETNGSNSIDLNLIQNTQISFEYLHSYDLFSAFVMDQRFEDHFSSRTIDFFSRLNKNKSDEKIFDYWRSLINRNIQLPAGTIRVSFYAYDPISANDFNNYIITKLTERLNTLNNNIYLSLVDANLKQMKNAEIYYLNSVANLARGRQDISLINPAKWADDIEKIVGELKSALLLSKSELSTLNSQVLGRSPQASIIEKRIYELNSELSELRNTLTAKSTPNENSVAESVRIISLLELQNSIAKKFLEISSERYEFSKQIAEIMHSYVQVFISPNIVAITTFYDRLVLLIGSVIVVFIVFISVLYGVQIIRARF